MGGKGGTYSATTGGAYQGCTNLTGSPVCGNNVLYLVDAYRDCINLTGAPTCGERVQYMNGAYYNCPNLYGNMYVYSNGISNIQDCFYGRNVSNKLDIYVTENSASLTTLLTNNASSMYGASITWTNDLATNGYYYNTDYNTYIYPVANVESARITNGDPDNMGNL